jgi:hypothetical protein
MCKMKNVITREEMGACAFLHVNFEKKLFFNFEILESSIFFLVILGVFNFVVWSFTRGEIGYLFFFCKLQRSFVLVFWNSEVFNFLLVILGVFNYFVWSFHKQGNMVCAFLNVNFESFLFSYFENLKSSIFFLSFWRFHMGFLGILGVVPICF